MKTKNEGIKERGLSSPQNHELEGPCSVEFPVNWHNKQLGEILTLNYGWSLPEKKRVTGDVPVFGSNGIVGYHNEPLVASKGIIVGRKGSAGNVHISRRPFCPIDTTFFITPTDTKLNLEFLYFFLLHVDLKRILGDVGVPGLNREMAYREQAWLPTEVSEQRKIAAVLRLLQRAIEQQERLLALTTELKKTLLHQLFTHGLRNEPQKQTEIGLIPESWGVVKLKEVCSFLSGGTPSKQKLEFWIGSIPWISPKDLKKPRLTDAVDHISQAALEDGSTLAPAGSVFVVIRGMILARDVPVALAEVPMAFNQDTKAIIPSNRITPDFLLYSLEAYKRNLFQKVGRSAHGTMTLMSSDIAQFLIPLPDKKEEQRQIADALFQVEKKMDIHRRKHATLSDLFRTLLHELMMARIQITLPCLEILENRGVG